jgi:hypothetical protein
MREILFRGQTRRKGEKVKNVSGEPMDSNWVYGGCLQGKGDFSIIYTYEPLEKMVVYSDTVGQFTGLTDKNGKKIFEGDVIEIFDRTFIVQFKNYRGGWFPFASGDGCGCCESETYAPDENGIVDCGEVIGNIHDNPELVEVAR